MSFRFGEFELDPERFELRRTGTPIHAEPQVLSVLIYLVQHRDRLVSKDELLEAVWGDAFVSEATLSSRIMAARRVLGDNGSDQHWIKTVHGRGFRFIGPMENQASDDVISLLSQASSAIEAIDYAEAEVKLLAAQSRLAEQPGLSAESAEWHRLMAQFLILRDGWGSNEALAHYEHALNLAEGVGAIRVLRSVRYHLATLFELRGEFLRSATLMAAAILEEDDAESRELLACSLFHQGRLSDSLNHAERGVHLPTDLGSCRLSAYYGENPTVSCHHWVALSLLLMGREEEALKHSSRALRLSEQPNQLYCLAHSRQQAAMLHQLRGDDRLCEHWATATVAIGIRQRLKYRELAGRILLGWSRIRLREHGSTTEMVEALSQLEALGAHMEAPYFQALTAESDLLLGEPMSALSRIESAIRVATESRTFFYTAELLRLRALCLRALAQPHDASLAQAIEVAEGQGALLFVQRARKEQAVALDRLR